MKKNNPLAFFKSNRTEVEDALNAVKQRLLILSLIRLLIFLLTFVGIYFFNQEKILLFCICIFGLSLFLITISQYVDSKNKKLYLVNKLVIIQKEIDFLELRKVDFEDGEEFVDNNHLFASDIDLFGQGSVFQYLNRTVIFEAKQMLASILKKNEIQDIPLKQEAIKELAMDPEWRLNYTAKSTVVKQSLRHHVIYNWLENYIPIIPQFFSYLSISFSVLTILAVLLYAFDVLSYLPLVIIFFSGLLITIIYIKKINKISIHLNELKEIFSHYSDLISHIENKDFLSTLCKKQKAKIKTDSVAASHLLKQFSKHLSALDQRNNILFAVFGNGFFLWDCQQILKIENWIVNNKEGVENWFDTIVWFDAFNSLANFSFIHHEFIFPEISTSNQFIIDAKKLGHFMLDPKKRISNDFSIKDESFTIVTGANMAGKSTFLRTVSSTIVFANIGLPVCAEKITYRPIKLVTSMRNTDSLQDDSSYFFAELSRLKMIIDAIQKEPYFIILDEILKGTNSKDKEEGSIRLMQKLAKTKSSGLIATHDLGLCTIEKGLPNIRNQYFDAEIIDDELVFDYTLKEGICQNMNASFLLKKMEII